MPQRYYDPMGRFLSVDPVTAYGSGDYRYFNRYAYAANNPYKFTDSDGRSRDTAVDAGFVIYDTGRFLGAAGAAIVGAVTGNSALQAEGLAGMRDTGVDLGASVASVAIPGLAAPMVRGGVNGAEAAVDASRADFVVTPGGTAVPTSQSRMTEGLDAAGVPSTPLPGGGGTSYDLGNGTTVRAMEP